ncbi:hypothetical protein PM10SUCC1_33300 [Propionigenium maris DSM 9537]|uniref:Lipoprotein n=1 Tax=Propionigenium maris DSM 9537 TaxID=1123000 RepID=A0A9W6GPV5_9FUSO|nr:hypothetical protein [Propionigenium maris]GLI57816.1 hypothetical protein PM10SUCC1_33300 [Propionigenium maris DSM 9537]
MKKIKSIMLVLFTLLLPACTNIPEESVSLSSEVGAGLKKQHQFQVELVNLYFDSKRKELDETMLKELDKYFNTLAPTGELKLNKDQFMDVLADAKEFNIKYNSAKKELEKSRVLLIKKLEEDYLALNQANSSITEILKSSAPEKDTGSEVAHSPSETSAVKINLEKALAEVDGFTLEDVEEGEKSIMIDDLHRKVFGESQE